MLSNILHTGITVTDLDRSVAFYRDVLGLSYQGELVMEGPETDVLFGRKGCRARVAYLKGGRAEGGALVELICFTSEEPEHQKTDLFRTSISELCFHTDDIQADYERMKKQGVEFLSAPQPFDFTSSGFGKSKAVYLRDPDGNILELMEYL